MYIEFGDCIYLYQNRKSRPSVEYIQAIFVWSVKFYLHKHFVSIYCLLVVGPKWKLLIVDSTCDFFLLLEYLLSGKDTLSFFFHISPTHTLTHSQKTSFADKLCFTVSELPQINSRRKKLRDEIIIIIIIRFTGRLLQYFGHILFLLRKLI